MTKEELGKLKKKSKEELQEFLKFKKHGFAIKPKKGKGSYRRNKRKEDERNAD